MPLKIDLKNRLYRLFWGVIYTIFVKPSPNFLFGWRRFLYRLFGASIGRGCRIYPLARVWDPSRLIMHQNSCIANNCLVYNVDYVVIGERSIISQGTRLITATKSFSRGGRELVTQPVTVGDDCWIAMEAFLSPGVKVGNGSVIFARVMILEDVPSNSVVKPLEGYKIEARKNQ
jgi:putative colanic acid biosynthesis acetyltransferase WcaF